MWAWWPFAPNDVPGRKAGVSDIIWQNYPQVRAAIEKSGPQDWIFIEDGRCGWVLIEAGKTLSFIMPRPPGVRPLRLKSSGP